MRMLGTKGSLVDRSTLNRGERVQAHGSALARKNHSAYEEECGFASGAMNLRYSRRVQVLLLCAAKRNDTCRRLRRVAERDFLLRRSSVLKQRIPPAIPFLVQQWCLRRLGFSELSWKGRQRSRP